MSPKRLMVAGMAATLALALAACGEDDEGVTDAMASATRIEVTGEGGGSLPATPATVVMREHSFTVEGLRAGRNRVTVRNEGDEPHHLIMAPLAEGATLEDVEEFAASEGESEGPPPIDFDNEQSTSVIASGEALVQELEVVAGRNVAVCFVSDREGGPPHVAEGMIDLVEVD